MKIQIICVFLVFSSLLFCSKKSTTGIEALSPIDLLPKNNEISGWLRTGENWTAGSSGDLTTYINGEAVIYTNRGFVEAAMQVYEGTVLDNTVNIEVRIFDQGTVDNAKSVFDELVNQMSSPIAWTPGAGEEAKIERYSLSQRIIFYKSKYFVSLLITTGIDEALDVLKTFANNMNTKI